MLLVVVVVVFSCSLFSNTFSQFVPFPVDPLRHRSYQYERISPEDIPNIVQYNLTPEKIAEYLSSSNDNNQSSQCDDQLNRIFQAEAKKELWAVKILDAWGKPLPAGIIKGNIYWVGDYNECVRPMYDPENRSYRFEPFETKHCTITPSPSSKGTNAIVLGVCVPLPCDRKDIIDLVQKLFKKHNITTDNVVCSSDPPNGHQHLTYGAIITIVILSLLALLVLFGTILDLILSSRLSTVNTMTAHINSYDYVADSGTLQPSSVNLPPKSRYSLQALIDVTPTTLFFAEFSFLKSLRRIFTMKQKTDDQTFPFIDGIRVLSLFCVIIGHSLDYSLSFSSNVLDVLAWSRNIAFQLLINAVLSVDTFFVLSGFLTAILFVRQVRKEQQLSFRLMILYYIHRYIRLTPAFLILVLVNINLTPYFGHGPMYPNHDGFETPQCRSQYWWTSIIYVGNLIKPEYMCLSVSWYLHNDMQFHWLAPLTLIPFVLRRKMFSYFLALLLVLLGCVSILFTLLYYPDMPLDFLTALTKPNDLRFFKYVYVTPWCRISAYAVGILTGYSVIEVNRRFRLSRCMKFVTSSFVIFVGLLCLFGTYPDYILSKGLDRSIQITYETLSRTLWSICIGWLLFLCSTNQGGIVNKILSWPIWSPLARLNYSCYLVHSIILLVIIFNQKVPTYFDGHTAVNRFVSHIFFSYLAAILVAVFIETPFFILEKKLFKR